MSQLKSAQITLAGKVQNIGFRFHTNEKAKQLGVNGYVKNLYNGNV